MSSEEDNGGDGLGDDDSRAAKIIDDADDDTIRIMVSTDNHLGYLEADAVRGNDSFAAMEEVLYLAKYYRCDLVLLAGDLFHDNKPSRRTMYKTMAIFRKYCMGPDPISIQILSDQSQNFRQGLVNYQNEFYSVDLPVMCIHGNHDDPSREGSELYAALDILDCANLVNYIGRQDQINQIQISPILMKKGDTHLALYGLGSMRDERLNRMWQGSNVTFLRPAQDADNAPEFFNLFALHQNRDKGRGSKNCVHETMIPEWMDLVCWGHEHECCIEPQESVVGTFRISQPGSSVATSLIAGEAIRKQVGLLDIRGQAFRLRPIPLTQVRTFIIGEISLQENRTLDPDDPKVEQKVKQLLKEEVDLLIYQAKEKAAEIQQWAQENGNIIARSAEHPLTNKLEKPDEVLVRLKVEHSGFSVVNNQRFGAQFIGQVANPTDILLFQRKSTAAAKSSSNKNKKTEPILPEQLDEMNIEDFIFGELEQSDRKLELFDEKRIAVALEDYVQKQEAQAIPETVNSLLTKQQNKLIKLGPIDASEDTTNKSASATQTQSDDEQQPVEAIKSSKRNQPLREPDEFGSDDADEEFHMATSSSTITKAESQSKANNRSRNKRSQEKLAATIDSIDDSSQSAAVKRAPSRRKKPVDEDLESDEEEASEAAALSKKDVGTARRTRAVNTRKKKVNYYAEDDSIDEDDVEDVDDSPLPKKSAATSRSRRVANTPGSTRSRSTLSQSQLSFAPIKRNENPATRKRGRTTMESDDEYQPATTTGSSYELDEDWGAAKTDTFDP